MNRVVDIIVGGQWGSEGKGHIAAQIANDYDCLVRTGAPNAGHTFYLGKEKVVLNVLPCGAFVNPTAMVIIAAGALLDRDAFFRELNMLKAMGMDTTPSGGRRIFIDEQVKVIEERHKAEEVEAGLFNAIGSTQHGVGAAMVDKIWRLNHISAAKHYPELAEFVAPTVEILSECIARGELILIEGTQGTLLSIDHGQYPKVTSRNAHAAGILAETGMPTSVVRDVIAVFRTYPIRVAGNSGDFGDDAKEISWSDIQQRSGAPYSILEKTTVTKRVRRIAEISRKMTIKSILLNDPTYAAITFMDYINHEDFGREHLKDLSDKSLQWLSQFYRDYGVKVKYITTSPMTMVTVNL